MADVSAFASLLSFPKPHGYANLQSFAKPRGIAEPRGVESQGLSEDAGRVQVGESTTPDGLYGLDPGAGLVSDRTATPGGHAALLLTLQSAVLANVHSATLPRVEIELFADPDLADHLFLAVDTSGDGAPDWMATYRSRTPLPLELQQLSYAGSAWVRRQPGQIELHLDTAVAGATSWLFATNPQLSRESLYPPEAGRPTWTLRGGIQLSSIDLPPVLDNSERGVSQSALTFAELREQVIPLWVDREQRLHAGEDRDQCRACQTGGRGSTACSRSCAMSGNVGAEGFSFGFNGAFMTSASCTTNCGSGYHACCACSPNVQFVGGFTPVILMQSTCTCVEDADCKS